MSWCQLVSCLKLSICDTCISVCTAVLLTRSHSEWRRQIANCRSVPLTLSRASPMQRSHMHIVITGTPDLRARSMSVYDVDVAQRSSLRIYSADTHSRYPPRRIDGSRGHFRDSISRTGRAHTRVYPLQRAQTLSESMYGDVHLMFAQESRGRSIASYKSSL